MVQDGLSMKDLVHSKQRKFIRINPSVRETVMLNELYTGSYILTSVSEDNDHFVNFEVDRTITSCYWRVTLDFNIEINNIQMGKTPLKENVVFTLNYKTRKKTFQFWKKDLLRDSYANHDGLLTMTVVLTIVEEFGLPNTGIPALIHRLDDTADFWLVVKNSTIPVHKLVLRINSLVFDDLLANRADIERVEIKDAFPEQIIVFVGMMHGYQPNFNYGMYIYLLLLCNRFKAEPIRSIILTHLARESYDNFQLLRLADTCNLHNLMDNVLRSMNSTDFERLSRDQNLFPLLSLDLRRVVHDRLRGFRGHFR